MCYFCEGTSRNYAAYLASASQAQSRIADEASFLAQAAQVDHLRFHESPEWSEPPIAASVRKFIFANPDPDEGLLLFILAAWLDLQAPYTRVWNQMLAEAERWIRGPAWESPEQDVPRGSFAPSRAHLLKTVATLRSSSFSRRVSTWFASSVLQIAHSHPDGAGNLLRFTSRVCSDLYEAKPEFNQLMRAGVLPADYVGTHYKRLWMLIMFLRRDAHAVGCLVHRALQRAPNGQEAFECWYNDALFPPQESELPVDTRVQSAWLELPFVMTPPRSVQATARDARQLARKSTVPPSSFDAILFVR